MPQSKERKAEYQRDQRAKSAEEGEPVQITPGQDREYQRAKPVEEAPYGSARAQELMTEAIRSLPSAEQAKILDRAFPQKRS